MISETVERMIEAGHDRETARILEQQRRKLSAAATSHERAEITRDCIAALRRALFATGDTRAALECCTN